MSLPCVCRVTPARRGVTPNYGQFDGNLQDRENQLQHLVSSVDNKGVDTPIKVHQDVNLFTSELTDMSKSVTITINPDRMAYLLCMEGSIKLEDESNSSNSVSAVKHDGVELQGQAQGPITVTVSPLELEETEGGKKSAHFIFFEMKQDAQCGRSDV